MKDRPCPRANAPRRLRWTPPGFRPFDTGEAPSEADTAEASDTGEQADAAKAQEPAESQETGNGAAVTAVNGGDDTAARIAAQSAAPANGEDPEAPAAEVPEFLRVSP